MQEFRQAEPPGFVTCSVYLCAVVVLVAGIVFVVLKGAGVI